MTTHTPGPWVIERGTVRHAGQRDSINRIVIGTPKNERGGRFVTATIEGPFAGNEEQAIANARLIAAAPALLAALKEMVATNQAQFGNKLSPSQRIATKNARAAISAAESDQPETTAQR